MPIGEALARCDARFATAWWHWFFMGQPAPLAERLIAADADAWYELDPDAMGEENYADAARAVASPAVQHAMCEDYRAGLGVDRHADDADRAAGRQITGPLLVLWGENDDLAGLYRRSSPASFRAAEQHPPGQRRQSRLPRRASGGRGPIG